VAEPDSLRESMQQRGYDLLHPIVVAAASGEIVDGRNRRDLALELDLGDVPVVERDFADDSAIAEFIVAQNICRRHLDASERRQLAGRLCASNGMSTRQAAKAAGVSTATAHRAASEARAAAGVSSETPARTIGSDGKSYPATKPSGYLKARQYDEAERNRT